jgi:ArsR family metal-binding transcriptional regulator
VFLKRYRKEVFRPECNPNFQSLHCIAHLDEDISEVLPYLNSALGGHRYCEDPPALTLKVHGRLITLHSHKIAINALEDEAQADKILEWLKQEINETWEKRREIEPIFESAPRPDILEVLKKLPRTNCGDCGQPTCMVFAVQLAEGAKGPEDCLPLDEQNSEKLQEYLEQFFSDS